MNRSIGILSIFVLLFCSCSLNEMTDVEATDSPVFFASFEGGPETRTFVNSDLFMFWHGDDAVSIFTSTLNEKYTFDGEYGDTGGTFTKVETGKFGTGQTISTNYSVYPYNSITKMNPDEAITVHLPEKQKYLSSYSFGQGSNTMVAVTSSPNDYFLNYKNVCGFLVVKLTGSGNVKSVTLKGNNGEKIAGTARVSASFEGTPSVQMDPLDSKDAIICECNYSVRLTSSPRAFWFCIPPVTFSKGFTVTVTSTDGKWMSKSTDASKTITRNVINTMAPLEVSFENDITYVEFEDPNLEEFILTECDIDGDGNICSWEAELVKSLNFTSATAITSLKGLESFTNLTDLVLYNISADILDLTSIKSLEDCDIFNSCVKAIDCSGLNKLKELDAWGFNDSSIDVLSSIDLEGCSSLEELNCPDNRNLSEINLSDCPDLVELTAYRCNLSSIDLTDNTELKTLYLTGNPLTSIDLSHNTELEWAALLESKIPSLDISNNTKLKTLCYNDVVIVGEGTSLEEFTLGFENDTIDSYTVPFTNLKSLSFWCGERSEFEYVDLSACTQLESFVTSWRHIKNIIFGPAAASLKNLEIACMSGDLSIDFSQFSSLEAIDCSGGTLKELDVSTLSNLKSLHCQDSPDLEEVWLKEGQVIEDFIHDETLCIRYK